MYLKPEKSTLFGRILTLWAFIESTLQGTVELKYEM